MRIHPRTPTRTTAHTQAKWFLRAARQAAERPHAPDRPNFYATFPPGSSRSLEGMGSSSLGGGCRGGRKACLRAERGGRGGGGRQVAHQPPRPWFMVGQRPCLRCVTEALHANYPHLGACAGREPFALLLAAPVPEVTNQAGLLACEGVSGPRTRTQWART